MGFQARASILARAWKPMLRPPSGNCRTIRPLALFHIVSLLRLVSIQVFLAKRIVRSSKSGDTLVPARISGSTSSGNRWLKDGTHELTRMRTNRLATASPIPFTIRVNCMFRSRFFA